MIKKYNCGKTFCDGHPKLFEVCCNRVHPTHKMGWCTIRYVVPQKCPKCQKFVNEMHQFYRYRFDYLICEDCFIENEYSESITNSKTK